MKQKVKFIIYLVSIILLACLLVSCQNNQSNEFQGYVEGELLYISSPFSGQVYNLNVVRGQTVKKGEALFSLDPEPELSQLKAAKRDLSQAQATLENLKKGQRETILESLQAQIIRIKAELQLTDLRVKRYQELYKTRATEKDTLDAALANHQAKMAELKQKEADLAEAKLGSRSDLIKAQEEAVAAATAKVEQTQWSFEQKTMVAPTNAKVFDTFFWQGEWVAAGKPIVALLAPQYIRFIFFIPETELGKVHLGDIINVSCDGCSQIYKAKISYLSPEAEFTPPVVYSRENNYNLVYRIKAIPNPDQAYLFHPGQPIYVELAKQEEK